MLTHYQVLHENQCGALNQTLTWTPNHNHYEDSGAIVTYTYSDSSYAWSDSYQIKYHAANITFLCIALMTSNMLS